MALIAKPVRNGELWVVTDGSAKVGNLEAINGGYQLRLADTVRTFDSTDTISSELAINFQKPRRVANKKLPYAVWPTTGRTYNNMYDVTRKIHLYTKSTSSKCYYAAGWFNIQQDGAWTTVFCPKYIFIQRYNYSGPYANSEEATKALVTCETSR